MQGCYRSGYCLHYCLSNLAQQCISNGLLLSFTLLEMFKQKLMIRVELAKLPALFPQRHNGTSCSLCTRKVALYRTLMASVTKLGNFFVTCSTTLGNTVRYITFGAVTPLFAMCLCTPPQSLWPSRHSVLYLIIKKHVPLG